MADKRVVKNVEGKAAELSKLFVGRSETVHVLPGNWTYLAAFKNYMTEYKKFEFHDTDVTVSTFPKSGTTWMQEIVWTMMQNPNLDHPMAHLPLNIRSPILEVDMLVEHLGQKRDSFFAEMFVSRFPDFDTSHGMGLHVARVSPTPRVLKTHLPFELISESALENGKVIYVIRDPRDTCISYYHHCKLFFYERFEGTFDQFVDAFINDAALYGPYWEHVRQAWEMRHHPNMYITFFEKMKLNLRGEIKKLNKFLNCNLTDDQVEKIANYTSFGEMKKRNNHVLAAQDAPKFMNKEVEEKDGGFFRTGTAGGWRNILTDEQKNKFEVWNILKCPDPEIFNNIFNP